MPWQRAARNYSTCICLCMKRKCMGFFSLSLRERAELKTSWIHGKEFSCQGDTSKTGSPGCRLIQGPFGLRSGRRGYNALSACSSSVHGEWQIIYKKRPSHFLCQNAFGQFAPHKRKERFLLGKKRMPFSIRKKKPITNRFIVQNWH